MLLLIVVLQILIITVPINGLLSIGEEFGWRAYLLPKLMERFVERASAPAEDPAHSYATGIHAAGARKASLLIGVIWGVWHWPLFFMSLKIDPTMPILFPLVYILSTCAMSVLLCWVTLRSGSVWPASIGHGAINAFSGLVQYTLKGPANLVLGPTTGGLIGSLGFFILALVMLFNRRAFAPEEGARSEREPAVAGA